MSIATELTTLASTKEAIKTAIIGKGQNLSGVPFSGYAAKIAGIPTGSSEWTQAFYDSVFASSWTRPATWLPMPANPKGFVGLYKICDTPGEVCSLRAYGNFTVDWGDGSALENFSSGIQAVHNYNYASIDPASTQPDGSRQVVVKVFPQSGQSFTQIRLHERAPGMTATYTPGWLDIDLSTDTTSTPPFINTAQAAAANVASGLLERFVWRGNFTGTSTSYMFSGCIRLQSVSMPLMPNVTNVSWMFLRCLLLKTIPMLDTAKATNFREMFASCSSLVTIPLINTAAATSFQRMFSSCFSLVSLPTLDTSKGSDFTFMFSTCRSLRTIPQFNTVAATQFGSMFDSCTALTEVPLLNTANVTSFDRTFSGCSALTTVPLFNTTKCTTFNFAFSACVSLTEVPLFNTASATNTSYMFNGCVSLLTVPLFDLKKVTNSGYMFIGCSSLIHVPPFDLRLVTSVTSMFSACSSLAAVPSFNFTGAVSGTSGMFATCSSLRKVDASTIRSSFSVADCTLMNAAALNAMFTSLPTVPSANNFSITITGTSGQATCDKSIATAKGWLVP